MNQLLKAAHQRAAWEAMRWEAMAKATLELITGSTPPRMISCWPGGSSPPIKIGKTRLGTYREKR